MSDIHPYHERFRNVRLPDCTKWGGRMMLTGVIPTQVNENDGGRSLSKRSKQRNDCTIRATALAFGLPYDEMYDLMAKAGRKSSRGTDRAISEKVWKDLAEKHDREIKKHSFQAVKGFERMNMSNFCLLHPKGKFILNMAGHHCCVIDGYAQDINVSSRLLHKCVYNAFEII